MQFPAVTNLHCQHYLTMLDLYQLLVLGLPHTCCGFFKIKIPFYFEGGFYTSVDALGMVLDLINADVHKAV